MKSLVHKLNKIVFWKKGAGIKVNFSILFQHVKIINLAPHFIGGIKIIFKYIAGWNYLNNLLPNLVGNPNYKDKNHEMSIKTRFTERELNLDQIHDIVF